MTPDDLDFMKKVLKRQGDFGKAIWLEQQLLRNLILDSGWMSEADLNAAIERAKKLPENIRQVEEHFADSDQILAEIGLANWLADLDRKYPSTE